MTRVVFHEQEYGGLASLQIAVQVEEPAGRRSMVTEATEESASEAVALSTTVPETGVPGLVRVTVGGVQSDADVHADVGVALTGEVRGGELHANERAGSEEQRAQDDEQLDLHGLSHSR